MYKSINEVCDLRDAFKNKCSVDLHISLVTRRRSIYSHCSGKALVVSTDFSDSCVSVVSTRPKKNSYFLPVYGGREGLSRIQEKAEDVSIGC